MHRSLEAINRLVPKTQLAALLLILVSWAEIYLLNLGSSELRSEEGHRVLPAVQMIDTGNYVVPYIGSEPYLRKPPLINWIVAASFKLCGLRNDWSARLPSPMFLLTVAILFLTIARHSLGRTASFVAALCWLTNLGLIEKGRMIEIEAIYVSLFAWALILWLVFWRQNRSAWLTYTVPWLVLGLGLLAKGPSHVMFFYALVVAVLLRSGQLRQLLHPAHLCGLALMLLIPAAWALPYLHALHWQAPLSTWGHEAAAAIHGEPARMENWSLNFPRGAGYFLPWLLLCPFIRPSKIANDIDREAVRALASASVLIFVVVLLIPGTLPRYVLPLMAPFCWIIAIAVRDNAFAWRLGKSAVPRALIIASIATVVVVAMIVFPLRSVMFLKRHEQLKPVAAEINAIVPAGARIYAVRPPYQPFLFYVRARLVYLQRLDDLPRGARFLLVPTGFRHMLAPGGQWARLHAQLLATTHSSSTQTMLYSVRGE